MIPWKLIRLLLLVTILIIFAGYNIGIVSINFVLFQVKDVPLFFVIFIAFIIGAFVTIPISYFSARKGLKKRISKIKEIKGKDIANKSRYIQ